MTCPAEGSRCQLTGSDVQGCVLCLVPCVHNDSSSHQDLQDLRLAKGSCVVQGAAVLLQAAQRLQQGQYRLEDQLHTRQHVLSELQQGQCRLGNQLPCKEACPV